MKQKKDLDVALLHRVHDIRRVETNTTENVIVNNHAHFSNEFRSFDEL